MKKLSVSAKILYLLNTKGGFKPKDIIKETKLKPASVYTALNTLRNQNKIAKEEDGVYISQTQTSTTEPTKVLTSVNKKKKAVKVNTNKLIKSPYITSLETQVHELEKLHDGWRQNYKKLEADYTQAKIMYLDSQAVVRYLESKIEQLFKD
jgi:hypothetical protein